MKRKPWNYSLPDGSIIYTHTNGVVYLVPFGEQYGSREIPRSLAAVILWGCRHKDLLRYI